MDQSWFEMHDICKKNYSNTVWIPLRVNKKNIDEGKYGHEGYKEDIFDSGSIAVPSSQIGNVKTLEWHDIDLIASNHAGVIERGEYLPADIYKNKRHNITGVHLVLDQYSSGDEPKIWHLNQDIVLTLALIREGNTWICPRDGYTEVAKLIVDEDNNPVLMEIKAEYLKDYLCARDMILYLTHFYARRLTCDDASHIAWDNHTKNEQIEFDTWEGYVTEIHEGGMKFGEESSILHIKRIDVDSSDDMPALSAPPTMENTKSESWIKGYSGKKIYDISGELCRKEIILPSKHSPKVRGDELPSTVYFTIDTENTKLRGEDLERSGKCLWFKPEVITALLATRNARLSFCTAQTGKIRCSYGSSTHFGVNRLGLVNIFAKDINRLPEWEKKIWAGYNISPDGGVAQELLDSQAAAKPADTQAPEEYLGKTLEQIKALAKQNIGINILKEHEYIPDLIKKIHRFRVVDEQSLYALAKDIARITADSLDAESMQTIAPPPEKVKWGSLKSLENLLTTKHDRGKIRNITAALVGVYELRLADAHLPTSELEKAFKLIKIDRAKPFVHQGYEMLSEVVSSLVDILDMLEKWEQYKGLNVKSSS